MYDHPAFPAELHKEIEAWVFANCQDERKEGQTDIQFVYTGRKKAIGPFKRQLWDLATKDAILASQAAAALANAALYRAIERQAITDGLTGLYNHRYFYERLNQEIARAQRYGLPLSLLMIDIDDFKHFNDRFGHPSGDIVLTEVGRILGENLRAGIDIAARYGGEEFTIVLPNTSRDGAQVVGTRLARQLSSLPGAPPVSDDGAVSVSERIRVSVAASSLPGVDGGTRITVSIGVACFPGPAGGPGELVRNADKALYLAKRLGKNRVEVFGD